MSPIHCFIADSTHYFHSFHFVNFFLHFFSIGKWYVSCSMNCVWLIIFFKTYLHWLSPTIFNSSSSQNTSVNSFNLQPTTPQNIIKGFEAAGIRPLTPNIFTDADFAPSKVSDIPPCPQQFASEADSESAAFVEVRQMASHSKGLLVLRILKGFRRLSQRKKQKKGGRKERRCLQRPPWRCTASECLQILQKLNFRKGFCFLI
uniref:Kinesin family member 21B [Hydra vulgaris] n=1 Tax=Lepeophtheirus salmonis TaxID=72036 RepID=A0A0K2TIG7_LEPSM